ncbi:MAG: type II toxin-antitoxin system VapC family toxin [Deferrisoma sp.]
MDTHAILWWLADDPRLGKRARAAISDGRNPVYVSAASAWEIAIKKGLGKLEAPDGLASVLVEAGFETLPIEFTHAERLASLPPIHRDPFDRILVAQAQVEDLVLVTADRTIPRYPVEVLDALQ